MKQHPENVKNYLDRMYRSERRQHECRARNPEEFISWQKQAKPEYLRLLKLPTIIDENRDHVPSVTISDERDELETCYRQEGWIETEPGVQIMFRILRPKHEGPYPLAVMPHGHGNGSETYSGIWRDEETRQMILDDDRDIGVQAATRGFLAITPSTRGIRNNPNSFRITDIAERHGGIDCRCHNWQVLMAGRTMMGERVWDLMTIIDWASALPEVDDSIILMMGNSGGGMATMHTAAADERINIAVPCCAYSNYISFFGTIRHCTCNTIPDILTFGEFWDVAGLVAPRFLLTVNGDNDSLHPVEEVEHAAARLKEIYTAAGVADHYQHQFGHGGHRFYKHIMWPWIEEKMAIIESSQ